MVDFFLSLSNTHVNKRLQQLSGQETREKLASIGATAVTVPLLQKFFNIVMAKDNEADAQGDDEAPASKEEANALSSTAAGVLERLLLVLGLYFQSEHDDFAVVLQKKSDGRQWRLFLHFWCLNPAVGFKSLSADARSIVLTSGSAIKKLQLVTLFIL